MDDSCFEGDGREEDLLASVVSGCHAPPVLEPAAHDFDPVAPFVAELVVLHRIVALFPAWDAGAYPFVFQLFPEPIGFLAAIPEQPFDLWRGAWP